MRHYQQLTDISNLRRAYRWIQSNPDAFYKNFFRDAYSAYAAASNRNLDRLRRHLVRHDYHPGHACKIFVPKPSGILRPISLLSVNDQIVYQSCANIIAERLHPKIRHRQGKTIFGHLYAGKSSQFFYRKWQPQYRAYTQTVIKHIHDGNVWVADFDLAAFYDSIDHHVLNHFLNDIGLDNEFCKFFFDCLKKWTSINWSDTRPAIYHEHGIPQGPLASGVISETLLRHFDSRGQRTARVKYVRYVDDIKLFAKTEPQLRQRLVALDLASKEVGLFPQSAKINIRRSINPANEIKSISIPPEPAARPGTSPSDVRKRLSFLMRQKPLTGQELTRFKFLLGTATPHHSLNRKLIKLLETRPDLGQNIARYFQRYTRLPRKAAEALIHLLVTDWVYHSVHAELLLATLTNMPEPQKSRCIMYCYNRLFQAQRGGLPPQPTLQAALAIWCIHHARLTFAELQELFSGYTTWWVRQHVLSYVKESHFGKPSLETFLLTVACDDHADVARAAAGRLVDEESAINASKLQSHESAKLVFLEAGYLRRIGRPRSLVDAAFKEIAKERYVSVDWRRLLGSNHRRAEELARRARQYFESNSLDSCVLQLDVLLDMIFAELFAVARPTAQYPNYGSALNNTHVMSRFPDTCRAFLKVHQLRINSQMAHPRNQRTGSWNRPIKHSDMKHVGPALRAAFRELKANGY